MGQRRFIDEVRSGGSFGSQHSFVVPFGLGPRTRADRVEVAWPSGTRDVVEAPGADQTIFIREGAGLAREQPFAPRRLAACGGA